MVVKRVAQDGRGFHHRAVSIRATVDAPRKAPAPLLLSFGRQGKSDDKNNGAGQAHDLFSFCKLLHPSPLCLRVFVLSSGINLADRLRRLTPPLRKSTVYKRDEILAGTLTRFNVPLISA